MAGIICLQTLPTSPPPASCQPHKHVPAQFQFLPRIADLWCVSSLRLLPSRRALLHKAPATNTAPATSTAGKRSQDASKYAEGGDTGAVASSSTKEVDVDVDVEVMPMRMDTAGKKPSDGTSAAAAKAKNAKQAEERKRALEEVFCNQGKVPASVQLWFDWRTGAVLGNGEKHKVANAVPWLITALKYAHHDRKIKEAARRYATRRRGLPRYISERDPPTPTTHAH